MLFILLPRSTSRLVRDPAHLALLYSSASVFLDARLAALALLLQPTTLPPTQHLPPPFSFSLVMFRSVVRKSSPLMAMSKAAARPAVVPRLGTLSSFFRSRRFKDVGTSLGSRRGLVWACARLWPAEDDEDGSRTGEEGRDSKGARADWGRGRASTAASSSLISPTGQAVCCQAAPDSVLPC